MLSNFMRQLLIILCFIAISCLTGCAVGPHQIGMSKASWSQLDRQQQQKYIATYKQQHDYFMHQALYDEEKGPSIKVMFLQCQVMMPPFDHNVFIRPNVFALKAGSCTEVRLQAKSPYQKRSVYMPVCYRQKLISFDPSYIDPSKKQGTLFIHFHPNWSQGMTYYNLYSKGYVRLQSCAIRVQLINKAHNSV